MYCGNDISIVISARYCVCNSFFTKSFSGRFPFRMPHYDERLHVLIMTSFEEQDNGKVSFFKISNDYK